MSILIYQIIINKLLTFVILETDFQPNEFTKRVLSIVDELKEGGIVRSDRQFAIAIGLDPTQISAARKPKRDIPDKYVHAISDVYGINKEYLRKGIGEKLTKVNIDKSPRLEASPMHLASDPHDYDNDGRQFEHQPGGIIRMRVKLVPHRVQAGYLRGFQDPEYYDNLKTVSIDVQKEHSGHYLAFEVTGDSMTTINPEDFKLLALPGWIAIGRELPHHHWKNKLHIKKVNHWILVHETEGILIKQIINHDVKNGLITIHSINPKYPDEVLSLADIAQIFSVQKFIVEP